MFQTVSLSIIKSFPLYTQQWCMNGVCHTGLLTACKWDQGKNQLDALISQIYFWNKTLHVSDSSSVHHQEFSTVYTAVVYIIRSSALILLASCQQTCMTYTTAECTVKKS